MATEENTTYQEIYDSFIWDRPTHFNFVNDVIDKWASKDKNKPYKTILNKHGSKYNWFN